MRLPTKLDLLLLWEQMGSKDVPPTAVSKDCFLFGQEIGKALISSSLPINDILSRYAFIESAQKDFERSVRLGMFSVIERNLENIQLEMSDIVAFVSDAIAKCPLTPPNLILRADGFDLLQRIHQDLQRAIYLRKDFEALCAIIDGIEVEGKTCNQLKGCYQYLQDNNFIPNL